MDIKELLPVDYDIYIKGIAEDSREVEEGYLFVATKGFYVDHYDYILDAIKKGCVFLVVDREISFDFPHLVVDSTSDIYQELCLKFHNLSLEKFYLIGITGTDGKTSTASMVKGLLPNCASIGTNGVNFLDKNIPTSNTTPCIFELYKDLSLIQKENISNVVMEVSSEALLHHRVDSLAYDIVCFTNITGDHLNVHGNFENYIESKMNLLKLVKKDGIVLANGDDPILKNIEANNLYTFGFLKDNDFVIEEVQSFSQMVKIKIRWNEKIYEIESPFKEKFNIYNVVLSFLVGLFSKTDEKVLKEKIRKLKRIPGRCEFLDFGQNYDVVLDYAHTIYGIKSILDAFQDYEEIIVVTGAAGGRDHTKRSVIGKMIMEKSDIAIFTMDDPRYENVDDIIDEMVGEGTCYIRIPSREEAICYALSIACSKSVVLILGKGRDNYMAIEDKKVPYSDYEVIKKFFQKEN